MIREDRHAHDQAVELAARAIDFQLTDAQASALDAHLATCPVCSRSAESPPW